MWGECRSELITELDFSMVSSFRSCVVVMLTASILSWSMLGCSVGSEPQHIPIKVEAKPIKSIFHVEGGTVSADSLYPLYPNPFSRSTGDTAILFKFSVNVRSNTILLIQNPIGDEIAKFTDTTLAPGVYPGSWQPAASDGSALKPGLYFVTLRVNDTTLQTGYINSRLVDITDN
jgi:hypothetical protein